MSSAPKTKRAKRSSCSPFKGSHDESIETSAMWGKSSTFQYVTQFHIPLHSRASGGRVTNASSSRSKRFLPPQVTRRQPAHSLLRRIAPFVMEIVYNFNRFLNREQKIKAAEQFFPSRYPDDLIRYNSFQSSRNAIKTYAECKLKKFARRLM
jgi:hypothetical protein